MAGNLLDIMMMFVSCIAYFRLSIGYYYRRDISTLAVKLAFDRTRPAVNDECARVYAMKVGSRVVFERARNLRQQRSAHTKPKQREREPRAIN